MFCPKCRAEYEAGITVCKDCNVALVHALPEEEELEIEPGEIPKDLKFEEILAGFDEDEIAYIKAVFDAAHITHYFTEASSTPSDAAGDSIKLMVREDQMGRALTLLFDADSGSASDVSEGEEP